MKEGCVVTSVPSALDAEHLIVAERRPYDAVLAPVDEHDPAPWIGRLRRRNPQMPVILIPSGAGGAQAAQEAMTALSRAISAQRPAAQVH